MSATRTSASIEPKPGTGTTVRVGRPDRRIWHSQGAKFYPREQRLFRDLQRLIQEYVLTGYTPASPQLEAADSVVTLGSCFARELRTYLEQSGVASDNIALNAELDNTYAILDFLSWIVTGRETGRGFRYETSSGDISEWTPPGGREKLLAKLHRGQAYVFTLGLAEIWEDRKTGGVFWRGIPADIFDARRHVFRLSTVEENEQNIRRIIELIRTLNPSAPIVLTLSPVPLKATFGDVSCVGADCLSKSTLRLALHRVMATKPTNVYYWPSFEIVRWIGAHLPWPAYGVDDGVSRHTTRYLVANIIDAFVEAFYTPAAVAELRAKNGSPSVGARSPRSPLVKLAVRRRELQQTAQRARNKLAGLNARSWERLARRRRARGAA